MQCRSRGAGRAAAQITNASRAITTIDQTGKKGRLDQVQEQAQRGDRDPPTARAQVLSRQQRGADQEDDDAGR